MTIRSIDERDRVSLCDTLDRVLNKGAVVSGELIISVADIDLLYVGLQVVLTSVATVEELRVSAGPAPAVSAERAER